ncbi:hypothetical protein [Glacieibacterium frigidum]|uniref:Uncharacterized protein n=1 Tax=Glacieibacterium frigidum TaxID=2593303 RepID=A0A552U7Q2_9SPHN|nr:hypothetical protein [Glacieibacterium frigidum]TRW14243.1 hypothetical protein FMM06_11025 [Glacieibacterium frigidum]
MRAALLLAAGLAATATAAEAAAWNFAFNQGIAEYSAGSFAEGGSSVALSCAESGVAPGSVSVSVRRAGFTPAKAEPVTFRVGTREVRMFTDAGGSVSYGSVAVAPRFRALWQMLGTGRGTLTVKYGPGAPMSFPLTGAAKLFGPVPCPKQLS